jgi:outer membrane protein assembly factor BamB
VDGKILHGNWSSPAVGKVGGVMQVVFSGPDGCAYAYEPKTGKRLWKFDLNPKDSVWQLGGRGTRNNIIATPVIYHDRVYLDVGQDPEHGEGAGHLYAIDATKRGDITETGKIWHIGGDDFHRSMSTVAVANGLLFATDLSGFLYCLDPDTGKEHWKYDTFSAIWGSPMLIGDKVYLGDEEGVVLVLSANKEKKLLATNEMGASVYTTPVAADGTLYVTNRRQLIAIQEGAMLKK